MILTRVSSSREAFKFCVTEVRVSDHFSLPLLESQVTPETRLRPDGMQNQISEPKLPTYKIRCYFYYLFPI